MQESEVVGGKEAFASKRSRGRSLQRIRAFDWAMAIDGMTARFAKVAPGSTLRKKAKAVLSDPKKLMILIAIVGGFSGAIFLLFATGVLADFYRAIYTFWPGRPWTHVMRDYPWIYVILALVFIWIPLALAGPSHWGRAVTSYVIYWVAFLGGHVFW